MEEQNPWWFGEVDEEYENWRTSQIRWLPPILREFNFRPFSLNFLVGPRQVGKTTALKIYVHECLLKRKKVNPKSVFYFSCEELTDFRELGEILDNYISVKKELHIKRAFIILDEITFVDEWYRALKLRIDKGKFKSDVIIVSGSASLELLQQREFFPGRRGYGKDVIFLPLSFPDYFEIFWKYKLAKSERIARVEATMRKNAVLRGRLLEALDSYLKTGGFPLPIKDFMSKGRISNLTEKTYIDWLRGDLLKAGKSERYAKEVISFVINARCAPLSWLSIARETSLVSPHTAQA